MVEKQINKQVGEGIEERKNSREKRGGKKRGGEKEKICGNNDGDGDDGDGI
ncbi:hypothetical protein BCD_1559 (plasmid) [Borrelia crocidurae DOU]|uniref:Uncharacterized protein n=1 Tax=Borrelia crocidurae DOU TaxID=1293575 RepID=W5SL63_9SPIR|nr:hypothetical protein BCD_1559 [Borrelia crocidurae DOU]